MRLPVARVTRSRRRARRRSKGQGVDAIRWRLTSELSRPQLYFVNGPVEDRRAAGLPQPDQERRVGRRGEFMRETPPTATAPNATMTARASRAEDRDTVQVPMTPSSGLLAVA